MIWPIMSTPFYSGWDIKHLESLSLSLMKDLEWQTSQISVATPRQSLGSNLEDQGHRDWQDSLHSKSRVSGSSKFKKHVHSLRFTFSFGKWVCRRGFSWEVSYLFLAEVDAVESRLLQYWSSPQQCRQMLATLASQKLKKDSKLQNL